MKNVKTRQEGWLQGWMRAPRAVPKSGGYKINGVFKSNCTLMMKTVGGGSHVVVLKKTREEERGKLKGEKKREEIQGYQVTHGTEDRAGGRLAGLC